MKGFTVLTAEQEMARLTKERDDARLLVEQFRTWAPQVIERAGRAEGERDGLQQAVNALKTAVENLQLVAENQRLRDRVAELERQLADVAKVTQAVPALMLEPRRG